MKDYKPNWTNLRFGWIKRGVLDDTRDTSDLYPYHIDSSNCWCEPELEYEDPETGNQVWVHREIQ